MLPFLTPRRQSGSVVATTKPTGGLEDQGHEEDFNPELLSHADDIIRAVHAKDSQALAIALEAAFCSMAADPMEEEEGEMEG